MQYVYGYVYQLASVYFHTIPALYIPNNIQSMGMRELWAGGGGQFSAPKAPFLSRRVWGGGGAEKKNNISA